jgi:hypothetical protein
MVRGESSTVAGVCVRENSNGCILLLIDYQNHPEVNFKPGPFYMGKWGKPVNYIMVIWTGKLDPS